MTTPDDIKEVRDWLIARRNEALTGANFSGENAIMLSHTIKMLAEYAVLLAHRPQQEKLTTSSPEIAKSRGPCFWPPECE